MFPNGWNEALGRHLFDEALARYIDWREACTAVKATYDEWSGGCGTDRPLLFAAYNAALDQEASAAVRYGGVLSRLATG
jgi:hypothetical protein